MLAEEKVMPGKKFREIGGGMMSMVGAPLSLLMLHMKLNVVALVSFRTPTTPMLDTTGGKSVEVNTSCQ